MSAVKHLLDMTRTAVAACTKPVQDQASKNTSRDMGGAQEGPATTEEIRLTLHPVFSDLQV